MTWNKNENEVAKSTIIEKNANVSNVKSKNERGFVTLLYGDTGTGKTYVSMTFPEPIFYVDTENRAINTKELLFRNKNVELFEPLELKQTITRNLDDMLDEVASLNNLTAYLSQKVSKIKSGEITKGTIVIDSITDVWIWIQDWMYSKLSKVQTKQGIARADEDMQSVASQLDWKIATHKHQEIVSVLRSLVKDGVNIVFTARQKSAPEYVTNQPTNKEKIRCQKEIPFVADITFNLVRKNNEYLAICEKLGAKPIPPQPIVELNYEKILKLKNSD